MAYGQKYYGFTEPRNYGSTTPEHQRKKIRVIRFPTLKGAAHGGSDKIKAALS